MTKMFDKNFDVFVWRKTKLNYSYRNIQFLLNGYNHSVGILVSVVGDCGTNMFGGGRSFYINESIPCKKVNLQLPEDFEWIALETNSRVRKWLIVGLYKPSNQHKSYFLQNLNLFR